MNEAEPLPLAGVRVLELCQNIMGPAGGLVLADLGADVIKVEPAPGGDKTRRLPGFAAGFFGAFNRNKRGIAIDIKRPEGLAALHRLAVTADVVIENYAPGTVERLGCGWDDLSRLNPRLIYCALKGFLSGPYENRPALDEVVQFMGGLAYMTGPPGRPLRAGSSVVDIMGGSFAAIAVMAALRERERTGRGSLVRSALFETTALLMAQHMAGEAVTGEEAVPMPARRGGWAIYEPFDTADGQQIFIGLTSDNHWRRFCEHFARPDLLADPRYASNEARVHERPALVPVVAEIARRHSRAEMADILAAIAVPFAPVARPRDLVDDPQLNAHGRMLEVELGAGRTARQPRLPIELVGHDLGLRRQPPTIGEHTREVLAELGYGEGEIDDLARREVIALGADNG